MEEFDQAERPSEEDASDLVLFRTHGNAALGREINRVKHNVPGATTIELNRIDDWNGSAWRRLGVIVGQSTNLKTLKVWFGNFDVVGFGAGLQLNRSIEKCLLQGINLDDPERLRSLSAFLSSNSSLKYIWLKQCSMGAGSILMLSNALASRSAVTLERFGLSKNNFGDADLDELVSALARNKSLGILEMDDCRIGRNGCTSLAKLLKDKETNLGTLSIMGNVIDDDCAVILAESLARNDKLRCLYLYGNGRITKRGWSAMSALVCDNTSIEGVMKSNHTLEHLVYEPKKVVIPVLGEDDASLLIASLELNGKCDKMYVARRKVIWGHARGDLNIGDSSIPSGFMPRIMSWFVDDTNEENANLIQYHDPPLPKAKIDTFRLDSIYRILRSRSELLTASGHDAHHPSRFNMLGKSDQGSILARLTGPNLRKGDLEDHFGRIRFTQFTLQLTSLVVFYLFISQR